MTICMITSDERGEDCNRESQRGIWAPKTNAVVRRNDSTRARATIMNKATVEIVGAVLGAQRSRAVDRNISTQAQSITTKKTATEKTGPLFGRLESIERPTRTILHERYDGRKED